MHDQTGEIDWCADHKKSSGDCKFKHNDFPDFMVVHAGKLLISHARADGAGGHFAHVSLQLVQGYIIIAIIARCSLRCWPDLVHVLVPGMHWFCVPFPTV